MSSGNKAESALAAADEEEWPDDIVEAHPSSGGGGGDDMYGDMLDSAWIGDLWGIGLIKETERLIAMALLKRAHIDRDYLWRDIFSEFVGDGDGDGDDDDDDDGDRDGPRVAAATSMTVAELKELYARKNDGKPINSVVLAAMCLRFGPQYRYLSTQLDVINESEPKGERGRKRRAVYKDFRLAKVLPGLTRTATIDVAEIVAYLKHFELVHELVEIQISRARQLLEGRRSEFVTTEYLTGLASQLGMTGIVGKVIMPLCVSALEYAGMHHESPCPLEVLEKYCIDRTNRGSSASMSGGHSQVRPMLMSLLMPKQFERDQMQAILTKDYSKGKGLAGKSVQMQQEQANKGGDHDLLVEEDGDGDTAAAARIRAIKAKLRAKHVMVLVKSIPTASGGSAISLAKLKTAMVRQYEHLSEYFVNLLCAVWFPAGEVMVDPGVVSRFFFPAGGFTVRVRMPMGGGFKISGRLSATDSTAKIYKVAVKQIFAKLKTMRNTPGAGAAARVPADVKLFNDETKSIIIPDSTKVCVGNEIDSGAKIYADSAYVASLMEDKEDDANGDGVMKGTRRSASKGRGGVGGSGGKGPPGKHDLKASAGASAAAGTVTGASGAASAVPVAPPAAKKMKKSKDKAGSLQQALDKLMTISEPIPVPPNPPFPSLPSEAHTWGIPLMTKYLRDELELPMYETAFLREEVTGRKFVSMDEDGVRRAFKMEHSLHSKKIADHAAYLRALVFERCSIIRPSKPVDWMSEHVAGWLACKLGCAACALAAFRHGLTGSALLAFTDAVPLVDLFRTVPVDNAEIGKALQGLAALVTGLCAVEPVPEKKRRKKKKCDAEEEKEVVAKEEKARAEAEVLRLHMENENLAAYEPLLSSIEHVLSHDFAMPLEPDSPRIDAGPAVKAVADKVGATVTGSSAAAVGDNRDRDGSVIGGSRLKEKRRLQQQQENEGDVEGQRSHADKENALPSNSHLPEQQQQQRDSSANDTSATTLLGSKQQEHTPEGGVDTPDASKQTSASVTDHSQKQQQDESASTDAVAAAAAAEAAVIAAAAAKEALQSERAAFEEKLGRLTSLIETQSANMRRLEETAAALKEESGRSEQLLKEERELTRQSIAELRQDRQAAGQVLDSMASQYLQDMNRGKQVLEDALAGVHQQQQRFAVAPALASAAALSANYNALQQPPADASAESVPAPATAPGSGSVPLLDVSTEGGANTTADATGGLSEPTAPALRPPAPEPAVPAGVDAPTTTIPTTAAAAAAAPAPEATIEEEDVPLVEFKSVGRTMGLGASRPLQDATDLVVFGGRRPMGGESDGLGSPAKASQDFQALFTQVADTEVQLWRAVIKRYVHKSASTMMVSETSAQMGRVSTLWLRLGNRMLDDSRKDLANPGPKTSALNTAKSGKEIVMEAAAAGGAAVSEPEVEEEDEEGLSTGLTKEMVEALRGLRRCAIALLHINEHPTTTGTKAIKAAASGSEDDWDRDADAYPGQERRTLLVGGDQSRDRKLKDSLQRKKKRQAERQLKKDAAQHARLRQAIQEEHSRQYDYDIAAAMVFCLGLARRLLDKYPSKSDYTHLLYLFTHLREGTLPLNELSRENIRTMLGSVLNVTLPSWPQFDSLCQRFDPEGKGFCSAPRMLAALKHVNPLGDGLGPGDYQGIVLLTLSTTEKQLGTMCKRFDAALLDVIFGAAARVASFDALVGGKKAVSETIDADDFDDWDDWADGEEVSEEEQERRSMKMADEVQLVSDVLLESSRPFYTAEDYRSKHIESHHTMTGKASTSGSGGAVATAHSFRREKPSPSCPLSFVAPTQHSLLSACSLTARGLQVYEGRREPILAAVETLCTIHMLFRLMVLSKLRDDEEALESEAAEAAIADAKQAASSSSGEQALQLDLQKQHRQKENPALRLTVPQIIDQIAYVETDMKQLLGNEKATVLIRQAASDAISLEEVERLLTELLGCPVPERGVLGLYTSQAQAECFIYHKHMARVFKDRDGSSSPNSGGGAAGTGAAAVSEKHKVHYQMALSEIAATLAEEMSEASSSARKSDGGATTTMRTKVHMSSSGKPVISSRDLAQSHLLMEMATLMHRQRVDQCAVMLDHLNSKAARRKMTLGAALSLLESLKVQIPGAKTISGAWATKPQDLVVLSVEEISRRTVDLKRMVQQDMAASPTEAVKQLVKKVNGLKQALRGGTIKDEDGALTMILQEIGTLEEHVAQASADCLDLICVILTKAEEHK